MNKNIEKLGKITEGYIDSPDVDDALILIYRILEGFEKRIKKVEDKQNRKISGPIITKVISREEKEKNIKVGGTDPD